MVHTSQWALCCSAYNSLSLATLQLRSVEWMVATKSAAAITSLLQKTSHSSKDDDDDLFFSLSSHLPPLNPIITTILSLKHRLNMIREKNHPPEKSKWEIFVNFISAITICKYWNEQRRQIHQKPSHVEKTKITMTDEPSQIELFRDKSDWWNFTWTCTDLEL